MSIKQLLLIAFAGGIGAVARYSTSGLAHRWFGSSFPWGTLTVNLIGCFLFGLVWSLCEDRLLLSSQTRLIVLTGFMGAFTTFSTFAFETSALLRDGQWAWAGINMAAHNFFGLACVLIGFAAGRLP